MRFKWLHTKFWVVCTPSVLIQLYTKIGEFRLLPKLIAYFCFVFRKYLRTEIDRHRPALGNCLGAFCSTFPVAFFEPHLNKHNPYSLLNRIADHSLEAQGAL